VTAADNPHVRSLHRCSRWNRACRHQQSNPSEFSPLLIEVFILRGLAHCIDRVEGVVWGSAEGEMFGEGEGVLNRVRVL